MHVVVAGGGSAGHIEPALAFADALRRRDPSAEVTALGTERGLDTRIIPARGYELAADPAGADAPPARPRPVRACPAGCGRPWRPRPTCCASRGPTCWWASAASCRARLPGGPPARRADRGARGEPPAGLGQPARRPAHAVRRDDLPGDADPRTPASSGCRSGAASPPWTGPRSGAEARATLRPGRRPPDAAGDRRLAGGQAAQRRGVRGGGRRCAPPACRCCTPPAPRTP